MMTTWRVHLSLFPLKMARAMHLDIALFPVVLPALVLLVAACLFSFVKSSRAGNSANRDPGLNVQRHDVNSKPVCDSCITGEYDESSGSDDGPPELLYSGDGESYSENESRAGFDSDSDAMQSYRQEQGFPRMSWQ